MEQLTNKEMAETIERAKKLLAYCNNTFDEDDPNYLAFMRNAGPFSHSFARALLQLAAERRWIIEFYCPVCGQSSQLDFLDDSQFKNVPIHPDAKLVVVCHNFNCQTKWEIFFRYEEIEDE
jgi:hypothetical protein